MHFLSQNNVEMLWEVLMDEDILKNKSADVVNQINQIFHKNIRPFYESERKNTNHLMELNKRFISLMINFVNKKYSSPSPSPIQTNIQNNNNNNNKPQFVTHEDIQANRMNEFESQYNLKQQEFKNAMSLPVPEVPKFSDKIDEPLGQMDVILKRTMAQRNYDIEQLNKNNPNNLTPSQIENFLKPKETSIKNEKLPPNVNVNITSQSQSQTHNNHHNNHNQTERKMKHIKIQENVDSRILDNEIVEINDFNNHQRENNGNMNMNENRKNINDEIYKRMQMYDQPPNKNININMQSQPHDQNKHVSWGPNEHIENDVLIDTYNMEIGTTNTDGNIDDDDLGLLFKKLKPVANNNNNKYIPQQQQQTIQIPQKLSVEERLDKLESMLTQILNKLQ